MTRFADRTDAGRALAGRLAAWHGCRDLLVLGLPRGGVPVAAEVAAALRAPLDVLPVRKLGWPGQEEVAMGAIGPGGVRVLNALAARAGAQAVEAAVARERIELARRAALYRGARPPLELTGRTVLLVDDGLATGATMQAAVQVARAGGARQVVVAVPVASAEALERLSKSADQVVSVAVPEPFGAVGAFYADFGQTSDAEVQRLLA